MPDQAPSIVDLHKLALACGWPRAEVHQMLHDWACRLWPVTSLKEMGPEERIAFAHQIRIGSSGATTPRLPRVYRRKPRERRGHPTEPGVIRLASQGQKRLIRAVASEMRWTESLLVGFLKTHFQCDSVDQIGSSARACKAIQLLKAYKAKKDRVRK